MASFNENVKIKVELKAKTGKAMEKIGRSLTQIKSSAKTLSGDLDQIEEDLDNFGESFGKKDDIQIGGEVDLDSIQDAVTTAKMTANRFTRAAGHSNIKIGAVYDKDSSFLDQLMEEVDVMNEAVEAGDPFAETKKEITEQNKKLAKSADNSVTELDREKNSFSDIITTGDTLTDVKQKVADANKNVQKMSKQSAKDVAGEDDKMYQLFETLGVVEEGLDEAGDTMGATSRQLGKMRRSTNKATDSMRAAAEVGDLFEDGLGSLSVNLGAFTIALRNFLTQVPLLLTALGAAGAAALGAAGGFLALAGAMTAVVGAGALAHAQSLKDEYAGIEDLGMSMQVIMLNLRDVFFEALKPLTDGRASINLFSAAVTGLARITNAMAKSIAGLTEGTEEFGDRMDAGAEPLYTVNDAFDDFGSKVGPAFLEVIGAMEMAFEVLGERMVQGTANVTSAFADMLDFSVWLYSQIDDLSGLVSDFGDTLAELAVLGARLGGGLIPVFEAFSAVLESIVSALNEVESETMQNAITFIVTSVAIAKVAGVMSSLLIILPNLVMGMANISAAANTASGAMATMHAATAAAGAQLGGFLNQTSMLGGISSLALAVAGTGERMRSVAFNSQVARAAFEDMAEGTDHASDELRELAVQGMFTNEVLKDLGDTDYDVTPDGQLDAKQFMPDSPISNLMFGNVGDSADDAARLANTRFRDSAGRLNWGFGSRKESDSPFKMFADSDDALLAARTRLNDLGKSLRGTLGAVKKASARFLGFLGTLVKVQLQAMWTALTFTKNLVTGLVRSGAAAIASAGKMLYLAWATSQNAKSTTTFTAALWNMITAQNISARAAIRDAVAKGAGAVANLALAAAEYVAASGALALAASLAVATGGILILIGLIGALAVGVIANFDKIKSVAGDTFGFLKEIMAIIADVAIEYFLTSWNLLVDAFQALLVGLSPLTDMLMDLGETLGIVGGEGGGMMSKLGSAGDFLKGVIGALGTVFGVLIDILGAVLWVMSTLLRLALTPLIFSINLLMEGLDLLSDFWNWIIEDMLGVEGGISGLIGMFLDLFDWLMAGIRAIPNAIESMINFVIGLINKFLAVIPFVSKMDTVSFTRDEKLKVSRDELSDATERMRSDAAEKGDNTIMYNEDNSTNIDQTVNADPEDQAQLSRVVTDAIAEANSFERRRQGGQ